ncbi:predicted protein [Histoplasma capsulatum H143]|uniref:Secreted protein n=1 Tax=Ajellomyces capsulatus (strain H143) TaxID=544712 RepID=C6H6L2_AJECH|nr:predicted protein [Histoplasma capsulatum H143]
MACLLFAVGCWLLAVGAAALYLLGTMAGDLGRDVHEVAGILLRSTHVGDVGWRFGWRLAYRPKSRGRTTSHLINRLLMVTARSNSAAEQLSSWIFLFRARFYIAIDNNLQPLDFHPQFCPIQILPQSHSVTILPPSYRESGT